MDMVGEGSNVSQLGGIFKENRAVSLGLVGAQFVLALALFWPVNGWDWNLRAVPGYALVALGLGLLGWTLAHNRPGNFSALPEVKPGARWVTSGPYRWVRHPMYSAALVFCAGFVALDGHPSKAAIWAGIALVFRWKAAIEERRLQERFPGYRERVAGLGRFVPRFRRGG
jgi:protein-S-isoprenylcysteine O-methyltransferase Ste14